MKAAGVLVAASLTLAACGSASPLAGSSASAISLHTRALNTAKIELAIEHSAWKQRTKRVRVACPSRVAQRKGVVFYCTAYYGRSSTPFAVTELDASGNVHYVAR